MSNLYDPKIDHEAYARIGRQLQAKETWNFFSDLGSQIKNTFSGKTNMRDEGGVTGRKC